MKCSAMSTKGREGLLSSAEKRHPNNVPYWGFIILIDIYGQLALDYVLEL